MAKGPITAKEIIALIDTALEQFGVYTYHDKGADEVMDINKIYVRLKSMGYSETVRVLTEVWEDKGDTDCGSFLTACVASFDGDSGDEVDEMFGSPVFQEWY